MPSHADLVALLLARLRQVCERLGGEAPAADAAVRFADVVDSMGFVEFLALVAEDCGVSVETIEQAAGHRFGSVAELAAVLASGGCEPPVPSQQGVHTPRSLTTAFRTHVWLAATVAGLPKRRQPASAINALLHRPSGWLESHAGIEARCL